VLIAAERLPELLAVHPGAALEPIIAAPPSRAGRAWTREDAVTSLLRDRLAMTGPVTAAALAASFGITEADADAALLALESDGVVLRGMFSPPAPPAPPASPAPEWCDRRLLARIHRYTLHRLRAEISPVTPADFMRFLFAWQHVERPHVLTGPDGVRAVIAQLDGVELPARAWERVLAARVDRYDPAALDMLCLTGAVGWARLSSGPTQVVGATPIALYMREHADAWMALRGVVRLKPDTTTDVEAGSRRLVIEHLRHRGASFTHDIAAACGMTADEVSTALGELVAAGLVSSDGFAGLRALIGDVRAAAAGRWCAVGEGAGDTSRQSALETLAWVLLRRYGVMFRRLLAREAPGVAWRELVQIYRRLEARGEIRGGRFVSGMSGEQFALPDAVERLREVRRSEPTGKLLTISAADPLNLTGIVTPEDSSRAGRIRVAAGNRVVYRNGIPIAAMEGDMLETLAAVEPEVAIEAAAAAAGRKVPVISGYVGRVN